MIVGCDLESFDEVGVLCVVIEFGVENFFDGIVVLVFWFVFFGLLGLIVYKVVNIVDSMIGYKNENYMDFGWVFVWFDDLINLLVLCLFGLFIVFVVLFVGGLVL